MKSRVGTPSSYKRSHKKSIRRKAGKNQRRRTLGLETLEERRVLSASPYNVDTLVQAHAVFAPDTPTWYVEQVNDALSGRWGAEYSTGEETAGAIERDEFRFNDANRWTRTATDSNPLTQGDPTTITWGFVSDGLMLPGDGLVELDSPSDLFSFLNGLYGGSGTTTESAQSQPWFQIFQQVFDRWEELSGIDFVYVPYDDGAPFPNVVTQTLGGDGQLNVRADIRIGGHAIDGLANVLAYAYGPNAGGGEIVIDTSDLYFADTSLNSLILRNMLAHEIGHALGLDHVDPVNQTKLMEPYISSLFDGPQHDDILAIQRAYGDAFEGNDSRGTASDITWWVNNGHTLQNVSIDDDSDIDYYRFDLPRGENFTRITLEPVGSVYQSGPQGGATPNFNSRTQSDLAIELLNHRGIILARADATGAGLSEIIDWTALDGGTYYVRVTGSANAAQLYNLMIQNDNTTPAAFGNVGGTVWQDENADGIFNGNESALSGRQLYVDANNNGQYDLGEQTTFSNTDGSYSFALLAPGTFRIAQVLPEDWEQTRPSNDGTYYVTVEADGNVSNLNFGSRLLRSSITGRKWADTNGDGAWQEGEPGRANSTVYVDLNGNGRLDLHEPAAVTDQDGRYTITNVPPGTHTVREVLTPGWELTTPGTYDVTLAPGDSATNLDFGGRVLEDGASIAAPYDAIHGSPVHGLLAGFQLGAANGVDDGVRFLTGMQPGQTAQVAIDIRYGGFPVGYVQAWVDFNGDGDWDDPGEQIIKNQRGVEGINVFSFQVPAWATTNPNANPLVRVRLGYENNLSPYARAMAGEVEDYAVRFPLAPDTGLVARNDSYFMLEDDPALDLNVLANDTLGPGGGTLLITQVTSASGGTVQIIDNGTRLRYTPQPNFFGQETFTYTVVDGLGGERQATVSIAVISVNDMPTANDDFFEVDSDAGSVTLNVLANDTTEPDPNETLTITAVTQPASGSVTIQGSTTLRYTPAPNFIGTETFTYTISDGNGGFDTATVTVEVAPLPDLVRFSIKTTDLDGNEITSALVGEEFLVEVYVQDLRSGGQGIYAAYLDLFYSQALVDIVPGSLVFGENYRQTPRGDTSVDGLIDEVGSTATEQTPSDPLGNAEHLLFTARFTATTEGLVELFGDPADQGNLAVVTIDPVMVVPNSRIEFGYTRLLVSAYNALDDTFFVDQDSSDVLLDVLGNDSLGPDPSTVSITNITGFTAGGTATAASGNAGILYTPAAGFAGIETFQYTLTDAAGKEVTATVTVTVRPPVDPPTAGDDSATVLEDSSSNIIPVLGNDQVGDGTALSIVNWTQPQHGTVTLSQDGQSFLYTPDPDYFGSDSFTYTVTDGIPGNFATATVDITVDPVNDDPTANDDSFNVEVDSTGVMLDVLANDSILPDAGETLTITSVGPTNQGGTVSIVGNTTLQYTPLSGFIGTETFSYTISDGNGGTSTATVTINVHDAQKVAFTVKLVDPQNPGTTVTQVEVGSWVQLEVYVEDLRSMPNGIGSAVIDLLYDNSLLDVDRSTLTHNTDNFGAGRAFFVEEQGLIRGVGSDSPSFGNLTGAGEYLLFSVQFVALAEGDAGFFTASSTANNTVVSLIDPAESVPNELIIFGDATLEIIGSQAAPISYYNVNNPLDVNADGYVNALDAAYLVDELIHRGKRSLTEPPVNALKLTQGSSKPQLFIDVDNDGRFSIIDYAMVVEELIRQADEVNRSNQMTANAMSTATLQTPASETPSAPQAFAAPLIAAASNDFSLPADETESTADQDADLDQGWGISLAASGAMSSTDGQQLSGATLTTVSSDPVEEELPAQNFSGAGFGSEVESLAFDLEDEDELEAILTDIADEIAVAWQE